MENRGHQNNATLLLDVDYEYHISFPVTSYTPPCYRCGHMPKVKRRAIRPKEPNVFSIRLTNEALKRLNELHDELRLDNRNATINHLILGYYKYQLYRDLIESMRRVFREEIDCRK